MKFLLTIAISITTLSVFGQRDTTLLIPFESNGLWGYMNLHKQVVVFPQFDEAYPTYGSMGKVRLGDKYGCINSKGEVTIKIKYDELDVIKQQYVVAIKNGKKVCVNEYGKVNRRFSMGCGYGSFGIQPRPAEQFVFKASNGKYGLAVRLVVKDSLGIIQHVPDTIDAVFDTIVSLSGQYMYVRKNGKIAFTNSSYYNSGSRFILSKMNFKYDSIQYFKKSSDETFSDIIGIKTDSLWGYYDVFRGFQGIELISPKYYSISNFEKQYAIIEYHPGKFGYVDRRGNEFFFRYEK